MSRFFKKYATFSGRASRSEFWWWCLANALITTALVVTTTLIRSILLAIAPEMVDTPGVGPELADAPSLIWLVGTIVPTLALIWRRLHDANMSGGWAFMYLVPGIGPIIFFLYMCSRSRSEGARFDRQN